VAFGSAGLSARLSAGRGPGRSVALSAAYNAGSPMSTPQAAPAVRPQRFGARIGMRPLVALLRRLATAYRAGVDPRRIWATETQGGPVGQRAAFKEIGQRTASGDPLSQSLRACGGVFPSLMSDMVELGEQTGKMDTVFTRLADHYEHLLEMRRNFLIGILWPAVQFVFAVLLVGLLIGIFGWITERNNGEMVDPLGFGLVGTRGLAIYFGGIGFLVAGVLLFAVAFRQGWLGASIARVMLALPVIGNCLRLNALARMAWTLSLALESGSDARRALRLSLRSSQLAYYEATANVADGVILRGGEFHEALRATGRFPDDFLLSLESAEHAGSVAESLDFISRDYAERARMANKLLTTAATFAIGAAVALFVIFLIFRLFMFYLGMIQDALKGL
jgi:type II secretory pathway component PulF